MRKVKGDLIKIALNKEFDVIIHGCNCFCTMGGGIARTVKDVFPEAYEADLATEKEDKNKLGSISCASVIRDGHEITIVNAYTQFNFGGGGILVDYDAVRSCMKEVKRLFSEKKIGYPMIGAGLAGGDWQIISKIIDEELNDADHTLVEFMRSI